jgi:AraC family transcriptional regulator
MEYPTPTIKELKEKKLIGVRLKMSLATNKTGELWKFFKPRLKELKNQVSTDLISLNIYDSSYYNNFSAISEFEKWAAIEVSNFDTVPNQMESFILSGGLYAVFNYKGSSADTGIFQYIFTTWLPNSKYQLDNRPHFEVLGEKYKNNDPNSEEEIWIPIVDK